MNAIFISYRRSDSQWIAARLHDHLRERLPLVRLYRDVDAIPIAADFREEVAKYIRVSEVVLVVIGRDWLTVQDAQGKSRLDDPRDFVRAEIAAALQQRKKIVPLLVEEAVMPAADELPTDLKPLAYLNALKLRADPDFRFDFQRLLDYLDEIYPSEARGPRRRVTIAAGAMLVVVLAASLLYSGFFRGDEPRLPPESSAQAEQKPPSEASPRTPQPLTSPPKSDEPEPSTKPEPRRPKLAAPREARPVPPTLPPPQPKPEPTAPKPEIPLGPVRVVLTQLKCLKPTMIGTADELRMRIIADGKQYEPKYPDKTNEGRACKLMRLEENWPLGFQFDFTDRVRVEIDELDTIGADDRNAFQFEITKQDFIKGTKLKREAHFIGEYHLEFKWPDKE